jgi:hypothetical protein
LNLISSKKRLTGGYTPKNMLLSELKLQAKELGIRGYSKMNKQSLQNALDTIRPPQAQAQASEIDDASETEQVEAPVEEKSEVNYNALTNKALREQAKLQGIKGISKLNKNDLISKLTSSA